MKKRLLCLLLLLTLFLFLVGCTSIEKSEEPTIKVDVPDSETFEETKEAVDEETSTPTEEPVDEAIVEEVEQEESAEVPKCRRKFSPTFSSEPHYMGPLFDAHFHMPNLIDTSQIDMSKIEEHYGPPPTASHTMVDRDAEVERLLCNFDKEQVKGAIGFVIGEEQLLDETLSAVKSVKTQVGNKVNLFLSPVGFSAASLESIEASDKGLFDGYGELSFGFGGGLQSNQYPDDPSFFDIYNIAGKHNLVVMIHIGARQESRIENILQKKPEVTFLFHGPESENFIHNVIGKYPNAYYSIDAMLIRIPGAPGALMYMVSSKEEFKTKFAQNYDAMLDNTVKKWKAKIEQYPDKYMWGTDRSDPWTYDEDVSAMIEEFSRDFIAELDPAVQEKFAYQNAEALMS